MQERRTHLEFQLAIDKNEQVEALLCYCVPLSCSQHGWRQELGLQSCTGNVVN